MLLNQDEYYSVKGSLQTEIKIKGSRFIANIFHAETKEEAEDLYKNLCRKYHNATHNCYAYRISEELFRYSDDGEPSGTAGKPILQMIDAKGLLEVIGVVTRYFGGVKLGTGGLIRAYSQAAQSAVDEIPLIKKTICFKFILSYGYELENTVRNIINRFKGIVENAEYTEQIKMIVAVPRSRSEMFLHEINEQTNSIVNAKRLD